MKRIRVCLLAILLLSAEFSIFANDGFVFTKGTLSVYISDNDDSVVKTAFDLFKQDVATVCDCKLEYTNIKKSQMVILSLANKKNEVLAKELGIDVTEVKGRHEAFVIKVVENNGRCRLVIVGSDKRGCAYGLMTMSRKLGVSPWEWWADCEPLKRDSVVLKSDYYICESPSVAYRGIFLNDEDWGLCPWSSMTYEPKMRKIHSEDTTVRKGEIGKYTHEKIFELLLRLRANSFWPAMHECSVPFYFTDGNKEMADKYGILVSTSHCEPMMRNTNGEWKTAGKGEYNFVTNSSNVTAFWEERVKALTGSDCIYTLGMRGVHDSGMKGAKTIDEQTKVLSDVIKVQRDMLAKYNKSEVSEIPQQFIPYKEVLDCYNNGLNVPDDVTLIWCDDNYGYIRHFPTAEERKRKGGHGMYYHISYWGRPHDYLWLSTTHPELIREEMTRAFDNGVQRTWILNVGDIKPMEYNMSLFLDMAWNIESFKTEPSLANYMREWYRSKFGDVVDLLMPLWRIYYDESFAMRPEFLGGTRTEEKDPKYKQIADLPLSADECLARLSKVKAIPMMLNTIVSKYREEHNAGECDNLECQVGNDAWFELVEYPLKSFAFMNEKMLGAQLARHGLWTWQSAKNAQDSIKVLTEKYNSLKDGKWNRMMDYKPRRLPVFDDVKEQTFVSDMKCNDYELLYKSPNAIGTKVTKDSPLIINTENESDTLILQVELLPIHPTNNNDVSFSIGLEGDKYQKIEYHTKGRSEEWKNNVLYNKSVREITLIRDNQRTPYNVIITSEHEGVYVQTVKKRISLCER